MGSNRHCEFCDEFSGGHQNAFATWYGAENRTVLETGHLKVLPSLGHFLNGYLLLVPKVHHCTLADAPPGTIDEVEDVKGSIVRELKATYGPYIFFEHGARTPESGGCGIYHAHLHAVPLAVDRPLAQLKEQFPLLRVASLRDLGVAAQGRSYLYYEDPSEERWLFFPKTLPSQYMRCLIAAATGVSQWDWRRSGREEALLNTRDEVARLLAVQV